jgi:hypothetical protein
MASQLFASFPIVPLRFCLQSHTRNLVPQGFKTVMNGFPIGFELNPHTWNELRENTICALLIENFLSKKKAQEVLKRSVMPSGPQFQDFSDKEAYFRAVKQHRKNCPPKKNASQEIVLRVQELFKESLNKSLENAKDPEYGKMFVGAIRKESHQALDFKYKPYSTLPSLDSIKRQFSCKVYLTDYPFGAKVIVYQCLASEGEIKRPNDQDLQKIPFVSITPKIGDLLLYNTQCLHEIKTGEGDDPNPDNLRLCVSSFIGEKSRGKLIIWS